jgi:hypothetical protein
VDDPDGDGDAPADVLDFRVVVAVVDFGRVVVVVLVVAAFDVVGAGEDLGAEVVDSGRCVVVAGDGFCGAVAAGPVVGVVAGAVPRAGASPPTAAGGGGGAAGGGTRSSRMAYSMIRANTGAETWPP